MGVHLSPIAKTDYAVAISIHLKRIQTGHPLDLNEQQLLYWEQIVDFYDIKKMDFSDLESMLPQELALSEKSIIFLSLFLCPFTYATKESLDKILDYYKTFRPMRYKAAQELVRISDTDEKDLKFVTASLLGFFGKYTFVGKSAYIIEIEEHENRNKINRINKQKIEQKLLEVSGYAADLDFIRENMSAILPYVHELLNISSTLSQQHEKLHIKIISKNGYMWEELLKYQIRQHFSTELLIFSDNDYSIGEADCDLIITDFPIIEKSPVEILTWNSPPTDLDFKMLRNFIK
ncbi:mga helix-turn-helix domain-containing protein [Listeria cornellensis FSL F6-0969]|uniref:Mga helix-turn-helix domain-containing protein n=2 Tax=Listeria cornellensis TaxID=1494961 RepID=W7C3R0_9LIST|nr:mga helix-turn-helix domain-containing protein [Listeria cornellensis FSL F6-0969]